MPDLPEPAPERSEPSEDVPGESPFRSFTVPGQPMRIQRPFPATTHEQIEPTSMMADHLREYKISNALLGSTITGASIAFLLGELKILSNHANDATLNWIFTLVLVAVLVLVIVWVGRIATLVTEEAVGLRRLVGTRWIPWPQVQDITIELNAAPIANKTTPRLVVAVYDHTGRRRVLPHINDKNLDGHGRMLKNDVAAIRATWERGRGADWAAIPQVTSKVMRRKRHPLNPAMVGLASAMISMPIAVVAFLALLLTGTIGWLGDWAPLAIFIVPVTAFAAVTTITAIKRKRAPGPETTAE